jgi:quercetin dioxygenase-like cupin family protein
MSKLIVRHSEDLPPSRASDRMTEEQLARHGDGEARSLRRNFFPVDGEALQLFEIALEPDADVAPHAHTASEIIFVTQGELRLGSQVAGPGSAIYIEAETLYGFRAGPAGATFLNFRADSSARYIFKEEFVARMRAGVPSAE